MLRRLAEVVFDCKHGQMLRKEGTSKTGQTILWVMYVRGKETNQISVSHNGQKSHANGKFYFPDPDKDK